MLSEFGPGPQERGHADPNQRFEEGLAKLADGLTKPRGCKTYAKVMERLGRLRVTVAIPNDKGERPYIRQTTDPEAFHG